MWAFFFSHWSRVRRHHTRNNGDSFEPGKYPWRLSRDPESHSCQAFRGSPPFRHQWVTLGSPVMPFLSHSAQLPRRVQMIQQLLTYSPKHPHFDEKQSKEQNQAIKSNPVTPGTRQLATAVVGEKGQSVQAHTR